MTPEERTKQIFDKVDQDKDGVITEEEFIDGARMDENLVKVLQKDQFRYWDQKTRLDENLVKVLQKDQFRYWDQKTRLDENLVKVLEKDQFRY